MLMNTEYDINRLQLVITIDSTDRLEDKKQIILSFSSRFPLFRCFDMISLLLSNSNNNMIAIYLQQKKQNNTMIMASSQQSKHLILLRW